MPVRLTRSILPPAWTSLTEAHTTEYRSPGLAVAGMAAVVHEALRSVAPVVSLYVNDFNQPARAAYKRVGFVDAGRFMSVLF